MRSFILQILACSLFLSSVVFAESRLDLAYRRAQLSKTKSIDQNIHLALNYLQSQKIETDADVDALEINIKNRNLEAIKKQFGDSIPDEFYKDDVSQLYASLDMKRTAEQSLDKQGNLIAYGCRTAALMLAELLVKSGVDPKSVYVVETVEAQDFQSLCPQKSADVRSVSASKLSLGGHVFVLVQMPNKEWRMFNPLRSYDSVYNIEGKGYRTISPLEMEASSRPVVIPHEMNPYLKEQGDLVVFSAKPIREVPYYKYDQRRNFIASGGVSNSICRKSLPFEGLTVPRATPSSQ